MTTPHDSEMREAFKKTDLFKYVFGESEMVAWDITEWWLAQFHSHTEGLIEKVEGLKKKFEELNDKNMYLTSVKGRDLLLQGLSAVKVLEDVLTIIRANQK